MDSRKNKQLIKSLFTSAILLFTAGFVYAQNYSSTASKISLYSSTPIEDIRASSTQGKSVIVPAKKQIAFQVAIRSFDFEKKMMQEHFNENYMESDRYPQAKFTGVIREDIDLKKDGTYPVTAKGTLNVHGVEQPRTIPGKLIVKSGAIHLDTKFGVKCVDHKIEIPTLVFNKIAEEINVTVSADYKPMN
ncbi:MAG: YceI family protein [Mucilaginibacter polytrichastri]|nr:YceI family protein [Mucilaginibacter polytrichastri]